MFPFLEVSRPDWSGLGAPWCIGRCPCLWQRDGAGWALWSFNPNHSRILTVVPEEKLAGNYCVGKITYKGV